MANAPGPFPTQILASQPAVRADGTLEPWFGQLMQLLLSYIGSPGSGSSTGGSGGGGTTITQQISDLMQAVSALPAPGVDASTQARLVALETAPRPALPLPPPVIYPPPLPPFPGGGGQLGMNEGTGYFVYDTSNSSPTDAVFRAIQAGSGGITVGYSTDGKSIVIGLYVPVPLTSNGSTLTSNGNTLTSG